MGTKPDKLIVHSISATRQTACVVVSEAKLKIKWLLKWLHLKQYYSINIYQVFCTTLQEKISKFHFLLIWMVLDELNHVIQNEIKLKSFEVFQWG